jgi:hypothetical protein
MASAWLGVHTLPLEGMHTAYVVPSENGGRGGVRWLAVRAPNTAPGEEEGEGEGEGGGEGRGGGGGLLLATGPLTPPLQVSVSAYSVGALTEAKHERELRPDMAPPNTALWPDMALPSTALRQPELPPSLMTVHNISLDELTISRQHGAPVPQPPPPRPQPPPTDRLREWREPSIYVHLDALHMGVGGHDSWTALKTVCEPYFISPHQRSYFRIRSDCLRWPLMVLDCLPHQRSSFSDQAVGARGRHGPLPRVSAGVGRSATRSSHAPFGH